jgi:aldehyde:ferredoxin oxidoreductase
VSLSAEQIKAFQDLYREKFGEELSEADARQKGERLIQLIRLIYKNNFKQHEQ